jgi:hypothetical protein
MTSKALHQTELSKQAKVEKVTQVQHLKKSLQKFMTEATQHSGTVQK